MFGDDLDDYEAACAAQKPPIWRVGQEAQRRFADELAAISKNIDMDVASINSGATEIELSGVSKVPEKFYSLLKIIPESKVERLKIISTAFKGEECAKALATAFESKKLTSLDLTQCTIDRVNAQTIAAALASGTITHLEIFGCDVEGLEVILAAVPKSNLTHLNISRTPMKQEQQVGLFATLPDSKVTHLEMTGVDDSGFKSLANCLPQTKITHLSLDKITPHGESIDDGIKAFASALPSSRVTNLDLKGDEFTYEGLKAIADVLPHSKITDISVPKNLKSYHRDERIAAETNRGIRALVEASLKTPGLQNFDGSHYIAPHESFGTFGRFPSSLVMLPMKHQKVDKVSAIAPKGTEI